MANALDKYDVAAIMKLHGAGKKPGEIAAELKVPTMIVGKIIKREIDPNPTPPDETDEKSKRGGAKKTTTTPVGTVRERVNAAIKNATGGGGRKKLTTNSVRHLWRGGFKLWGYFFGEGWHLTESETNDLTEETVETIGLVPAPIASAVDKIARPFVLVSTFGAIVKSRLDAAMEQAIEEERRAATPGAEAPPPPRESYVPPPPPPTRTAAATTQQEHPAPPPKPAPTKENLGPPSREAKRGGVSAIPGLGIEL